MSKSTFFKRIALTAIAALGFGMLSVAPSQALVSGETLTIGETSAATTTSYSLSAAIGDTATAVVSHSFLASGSNDSVVINVAQSSSAHGGTLRLTLTDSSNGRASTVEPTYTSDAANGTGTNLLPDFAGRATSTALTTVVVSDSSVSGTRQLNTVMRFDVGGITTAGTYTFTIATENHAMSGATYTVATGKTVTLTLTVAAADLQATAASTSTLREAGKPVSSGTREGTDSAVSVTKSSTRTTPDATIWIYQKNGAATANESMIASVSGPAYVSASDSSVRPVTSALTVKNGWDATAPSGYTPIHVWSTGTAGTATITVTTISGVTLGTETVIFTGNVTKMEVAATYAKVLRAGGYAASASEGNGTIEVFLSDANGNGVTGTITMVSSNTDAVNSSSTAASCAALTSIAGYTSLAYRGYYECDATTTSTSTSGMASTLTYRVADPAFTETTVYFTVTTDVTLGGSASTWTVTSDKTSYNPGEAMVVSAACADLSGNPCYDGTSGPTFLVSNKSLGGTAIGSVMNAVYDGKSTSQVRSSTDSREFRTTNTLFAPNASGAFEIAGTYGTNGSKSVKLELTVGDDAATSAATAASDAALEAIDAANAATDAANLAAEAADAATVAAEEARDAADAATAAVEALASEVATLMAALKAQITTLAKTVAKIAKKVKA
jgi:hypothetical protein